MVIEKANELGQALAQSEQFQNFVKMRDLVDSDPVASSLIQEYQNKEELLKQAMLIDPQATAMESLQLKEQLDTLRAQIQADSMIGELMKAQALFQMLMAQVNDAIGHHINPNSGCGGGCEDCSGCH